MQGPFRRNTVKESSLYLRQLLVGPMENFIYLIGDTATRECLMVDPAWDVRSVLDAAARDEMKVTGGLVTHTHFDHVNGVEDLVTETQCRIYVHRHEAPFLKGLKDHLVATEGGGKIRIGRFELTFLHTPGHTPGSQCFLIEDRLVSGDTLFINACGRCDLPGGDAGQMYQSLQRLATLDDRTVLLPGHNYDTRPTSTLGEEKAQNPYYQLHSLAEFLGSRMV